MPNYKQIQNTIKNSRNFVGGVLYKDTIYILVMNDYKSMSVLCCMPKLRSCGDEWVSFTTSDYLKAVSFEQGGFSFVGVGKSTVCIDKNQMSDLEKSLSLHKNEGDARFGLIYDIKVIDDELYCSTGESLIKYLGNGKWESIIKADEVVNTKGDNYILSFDGFSKDEIYLSLYPYKLFILKNGKLRKTKLKIPKAQGSYDDIKNIICINDEVYFNSYTKIIIGRENKWDKIIDIPKASAQNRIEHIVWFKDKLHVLLNSGDFYVIEDNKVKEIKLSLHVKMPNVSIKSSVSANEN